MANLQCASSLWTGLEHHERMREEACGSGMGVDVSGTYRVFVYLEAPLQPG